MNKHAYSLDAFRVIAILCVFLDHLLFFNKGLVEGYRISPGLCDAIMFFGAIAAHFFIVLSAFLVAFLYEKNISQGYVLFVKKRARRILPINIVTLPFYVIILVYIGFYTLSWERSIIDILLSSLLLQELFKFSAALFNTPAWTISTLFILWMLTPLLMWPLKKIENPGILIVLVILLTLGDVEYRAWLSTMKPDSFWINYASPINRILSYIEGLTLGYAAKVYVCSMDIRRHITWAELVVFAVFLYGCSLVGRNQNMSYYFIMYSTPFLIAVCFMESGWISKIVGMWGLSKLSPYVYAFYMSHFFFILLAHAICDKILGIWGKMSVVQVLFMLGATFVSVCVASVLLHHYVEKRVA